MEQSIATTPTAAFEGWAIVEIMGHQRLAGYVTTEGWPDCHKDLLYNPTCHREFAGKLHAAD